MRLFLMILFLLGAGSVGADSGVIDLKSWKGRSTSLDGEWGFTPASGIPTILTVPGGWNSVLGGSDGWGIYHVSLVLSDPPPTDLALSLAVINSSSEVYWNGRKVWATGVWSRDREHYAPERRSGVVSLPGIAGPNQLEIRVANWGDINAGLTESLKIGTLAGLLAERSSDITLSVFLFGCLFVMGVYHLGLFFYRPADRGPLWFGLISILLGLRGLAYGPTYLAEIAPWLGWEVMMKIGYLTFSATGLLFALFIRDLFPRMTPKWFTSVAYAGAGTYAAANLLFPAAWYTPALPWFQAYVGGLGVIVVVILIKAAWKRERGAWMFLAGFLLFFATVVNDIVKTNAFIATPFLAPFGLLLFLVFQSLVMLRKFTAAFADSERYSQHLARLNLSLERFIPKEVLSFLEKESIVEIELGDHCQRPMSVLFADIRDFTTLSESMTPEENFKFINSYLRRMGPVVRRHSGFVDKYMGDGIMALFPGEPKNAIEAALDLRLALAEYNHHRTKSGYAVIRMGIGIHRGPLMLGTIGENQRMDSTVISDTVNAASRLEGLTKKFKKDILISGETVEALGIEGAADYRLEYLDEETVKGRARPMKVYSLNLLEVV